MSLQSPQLIAFVAVVKHKTVHAAADAIALTQTAVTQRIKALELQLGATLFIRSRRGMKLTPEGEALLRYCEAAKDLEGEALAQIQGSGLASTVRVIITGPTTIMRSRLIPQCLPVLTKHQNLLMTFDIDDSERRVNKLRTGEAQLALVQDELVAREMHSKSLRAEEFVLVCSSQWRGRSLSSILENERQIDFDENDEMTFLYLNAHQLSGETKQDRIFANDTESMAYLLSNALGYGVLTKEFCKPFVDAKKLMILNKGKTYHHKVSLAWYPRSQAPGYFSDLIDAIG